MSGHDRDREAVREAIARARAAQEEIAHWEQGRVDAAVAAAGWQVYAERASRSLARLARAETGMGDEEDLHLVHRKRVLGTLRDLAGARTVGLVARSPHAGTATYAKPVGVIASATPATAPATGVATNALGMLKTRNAVVFSPNPRALRTARATVAGLRHGLAQAGAPVDLVQCLAGGRESVAGLMAAADLVAAAGGTGTVRRAYSSGTPAISSGVGNPPVLVDETADLARAVDCVVEGAGFNNGTSCSSESNVLVSAEVADAFLAGAVRRGAHLCTSEQTALLRDVLWPDGRRLDRRAVGRPAADLARMAGFALPGAGAETVALVVPFDSYKETEPFFGEKLAPVLTFQAYDDFEQAVDDVTRMLDDCGRGHSCAIHTTRDDRVHRLALRAPSCRVMVNQSTGAGNTGSFDNGLPFTSVVSSGTWGGCSRSENVTWRDFLNYTTVSRTIPAAVPDEAELFAAHWAAHGRALGAADGAGGPLQAGKG